MTEKPAELPAEFRLVAACCIWPPSQRRNTAIRSAAAAAIDWEIFLQIVTRQRVPGLVHDGLKGADVGVPATVTSRLAAAAGETARQALQLAFEAVRIQAAFDLADIPILFIKGSALALLAYGNLGIKHAWDIDILVPPADVRRACDILRQTGYARTIPPADFADDRFFTWTEFAGESIFQNPVRGSFVELHWRLSDNSGLLGHISARSPSRSVTIYADHALRTLCDEDLFAYLCQHGAHHGWSRLKWLADLCAWTSAKAPKDVERLYRRAQAAGVGRAAAQALLLCERLFAMPLPPPLLAEMRADRVVRWLVAIALDAMTGAGAVQRTQDRLLGDLKVELSHFLLAPGMRHWLHEINAKAIGWRDFQRFALPRPLFFLYPLLRVPSWIWRRAAYLLGQSRQPAE